MHKNENSIEIFPDFRPVLNQSFELINWKRPFEHVCHFLPNFKSETLISASHWERFLGNLMTEKFALNFHSVLILYTFLPICTWQLQVQIRLDLRCCYQLLWSRCIWSLCYKAKWWACKCLRNRLLFSFSRAYFPHFSDTLIYNKLYVFLYKACLSLQPAMRETLQSQKAPECWREQSPKLLHPPSTPVSVSLDLSVSFLLPSSSPSLSLFTLSHAMLSGHICVRQRVNKNDRQNSVWVRERFLETMTNLLPNSSELYLRRNFSLRSHSHY